MTGRAVGEPAGLRVVDVWEGPLGDERSIPDRSARPTEVALAVWSLGDEPRAASMSGDSGRSAQPDCKGKERRSSRAPRAPQRKKAVDWDRYGDLTNVICLTTATSVSPKIRGAVRYLDKNFPHKLTLRSVGRHIAYHPNYLCRKFREELGVSFAEYLVRVRLQKAIRWLVYTDNPIKEVGYRARFGRPERFSRVFRQWIRGPVNPERNLRRPGTDWVTHQALKFLTDENISPRVVVFLRQRGQADRFVESHPCERQGFSRP